MINDVLNRPNSCLMGNLFFGKGGVLVFNYPTAGIFTPLSGVFCTHPKPLPIKGSTHLDQPFECRLYEYSVRQFLLNPIQSQTVVLRGQN
jgi:hypothetical protein